MLGRLIKGEIAPLLKSAGFRKSRTVWNRATPELVQVLDLQDKKRRRLEGSAEFTLNLGLWIEEVWWCCWGKSAPAFIREIDCFPRFRIGKLLYDFQPRSLDRWWELNGEASLAEVGEEVSGIIKNTCLPFFNSHTTVNEVLAFSREKRPIRFPLDELCMAILEFLEGDREAAERKLSELAEDDHWGCRTREVLDRLHERA